MDFAWSDEEKALSEKVADFASASLCDGVVQRDHSSTFSTDLWRRCANEGVIGWGVPTELGGSGYSALRCAHLLEALGYGCDDNGLLFALGTQMWGVQSCLLQFASDQQKEKYIPDMLTGKIFGAYTINEPTSGSDAYALQTVAIEEKDGYLLTGKKSLISMAPVADFAIVFALTDPDAGRWGLSAFIVDIGGPGIKVSSNVSMMGLRTVPFGDISFDACRIPKSAMLGKPGAGASIFAYSQGWERSLMFGTQVGAMRKQLDQCIAYAKTRKQSGQSISNYQAVSHRLANMRIRLETSRLLLYQAAWILSQGKQNLLEAAMTKTHISEAFVESSKDAISLFGGSGYLSETGVERNLRDALGSTIYGGTVDIQRNIIAGLIGL